jgi:hypothetical protein
VAISVSAPSETRNIQRLNIEVRPKQLAKVGPTKRRYGKTRQEKSWVSLGRSSWEIQHMG